MAKGLSIKTMLVVKRAKSIRREAEFSFNAQVHHCCRVSANNHGIAFIIERVGIFRGPKIHQIDKPKVVVLSEAQDYVVVKEGYAYELSRKAE